MYLACTPVQICKEGNSRPASQEDPTLLPPVVPPWGVGPPPSQTLGKCESNH
jgi:hypothetical protein